MPTVIQDLCVIRQRGHHQLSTHEGFQVPYITHETWSSQAGNMMALGNARWENPAGRIVSVLPKIESCPRVASCRENRDTAGQSPDDLGCFRHCSTYIMGVILKRSSRLFKI